MTRSGSRTTATTGWREPCGQSTRDGVQMWLGGSKPAPSASITICPIIIADVDDQGQRRRDEVRPGVPDVLSAVPIDLSVSQGRYEAFRLRRCRWRYGGLRSGRETFARPGVLVLAIRPRARRWILGDLLGGDTRKSRISVPRQRRSVP